MRKFLILLSLWLMVATRLFASETFTLADGSSISGDIVKHDDYEVMIHMEDKNKNVAWPLFSQETLKKLCLNPKYRPYAEPFLDAVATAKPSISVTPPTHMTPPSQLHPSILGGMFGSSLGLFMLLVIYAANLYAAFEIAVVQGRPPAIVMGLSAVLPIVGPIIFLVQPVKPVSQEETAAHEPAPSAPAPVFTTPGQAAEDIQIVAASWQGDKDEKKPEPQVFARGKFTFNKRFIETKFPGFIGGEPKGDAKTFSMSIKTTKGTFQVECIRQAGQTEGIVDTPQGQLTIAFADIQEIKLTPKSA